MARKRYKPEEIVSLLRQAEVLHGQGKSMADAIRQLGISEVTYYRWRKGVWRDERRPASPSQWCLRRRTSGCAVRFPT